MNAAAHPAPKPEPLVSVLDEDLSDIDLDAQIKCVKREIAMRANAYPKWIANGRFSAERAARETRAMRAVLKTLLRLRQAEPALRGALGA